MGTRHAMHIFFYCIIAALFAALAVQFFTGDLGIFESGQKQRTIAALLADIAALQNAAGEKHAEIEKLTRDKNVIRSYALLYGMTGGSAYPYMPSSAAAPAAEPEHRAAPADHEAKIKAAPPFLLRHPVLIVLLSAIAVSIIAFSVQLRLRASAFHRKQGQAQSGERAGSVFVSVKYP